MIVVDSSALVDSLVGRPPSWPLLTRLAADRDLHAPHLVDVEVLNALRGLVQIGELSDSRAADARTDFARLAITRYPHQGLADRMWELRHNLTAYDAAFVVLSEMLDAPLITTDRRLAEAPGHHSQVEVFAPPRR